ncbi:14196_t:CDS:2, partial [Funneliformis caledonium]
GDSGICLAEDAVDAVKDVCEIITKWQKKVLNFYNKNSTKLQIVMRRTRDVTIDEVDAMIKYKQARNRDAHKSIWNPFKSNRKHDQAIERISIANHRRAINWRLYVTLKKCVKNLYA